MDTLAFFLYFDSAERLASNAGSMSDMWVSKAGSMSDMWVSKQSSLFLCLPKVVVAAL